MSYAEDYDEPAKPPVKAGEALMRQLLEAQRSTLEVLREIRDVLKLGVQAQAKRPAPAAAKPAAAGSGGEVASDRELDGEYGDPLLKKDPPRWKGQTYAGHRYSETEPAFLECLADFLDWKADRPREGDDPKWSTYARNDAKKARGWAERLRKQAPMAESPGNSAADDAAIDLADIPF